MTPIASNSKSKRSEEVQVSEVVQVAQVSDKKKAERHPRREK